MWKAVKNDNTDLSSGRMGYQFDAKSHQISVTHVFSQFVWFYTMLC